MFSVHQKVFFKKHTEKVAVNTVVGLLYKVLKNCLLQACNVFDVKMIQIWTFPAAPSTERVPSLAERVAYLRYSINLRLFNWRVPGLVLTQKDINSTLFWETLCWITGGSKWDHLLQSWNFLPNKKHTLLPHQPNPQICSEVRLKVGRYRDISQIGGISKSGSTI